MSDEKQEEQQPTKITVYVRELTPEEIQKAGQAIYDRRQGEFACIWCNHKPLMIEKHLYEWPSDAHFHQFPDVRHRYPVVVVSCGNCGLALPFSATILGIETPLYLQTTAEETPE